MKLWGGAQQHKKEGRCPVNILISHPLISNGCLHQDRCNHRAPLGLKVVLGLWNPMEKLWFCKSCASGRCWLSVTLLLCCLSGFLRLACVKSSSCVGDGLWQQWLPDAGRCSCSYVSGGHTGFCTRLPIWRSTERGGKKGFSWVSREVVPILLLSSLSGLGPPSQLRASLCPLCTHAAAGCC